MMILICMKTGLTAGGKVYEKGDFFLIPPVIAQDFRSDMSDEKWQRKQMQLYGEVLFRKPLPDDLKEAISVTKKLSLSDITDPKQKLVALRAIQDKVIKQKKAVEELIEGAEAQIEGVSKKEKTFSAGELKQKKEKALEAEEKKKNWEKTFSAGELKQKKEKALEVEKKKEKALKAGELKEEEKVPEKEEEKEESEKEEEKPSKSKTETKKKT